MPMLFSPTIGAAITAGYCFLRANATIETYLDLELGPAASAAARVNGGING
jgi:hypothetical protein